MSSLSDAFRRKTAEADALLTPAERVARAFRLGDDDAEAVYAGLGFERAGSQINLSKA